MPNPTQPDPARLRVTLDQGEVVELDGATLRLDSGEAPSLLLRMAAPRARTVARILAEWSTLSRTFTRSPRPYLDELDLSRTLDLAAAVLDGGHDPALRAPRGPRAVTQQQRLSAVAELATREAHLSAMQRVAVVDAAAWWLGDPQGGDELAYALLAAACTADVTTEHVYLALITPADAPHEHRDDPPR